jgi:mannose-1-phosphate guanylyltransferase/mannose-6-phosphate isomerase
MKVKPVIICGGSGTRLWPESKKNLPKQFIDFGGWTLFQKTIERIKNPIFDYPIISTNILYVKLIHKFLKKFNVNDYRIILEPVKKNTAPAILTSALLKEIPLDQPMIFFPADHLINNNNQLIKSINSNKKHLNKENLFIFGIKPNIPSTEYGYFYTKRSKKTNRVIKFIEKPSINVAKKIIKRGAYWNSGILLARKESIIKNFKTYQPSIFRICKESLSIKKKNNKVYFLKKNKFNKIKSISFDYAILEKSKNINGIKIKLSWSDLGSWSEISKVFKKNKFKYFKKSNTFFRPWGKYINLYSGNGFLVKELTVNPFSSISLQKHHHRAEHWTIISGKPKITINKKIFFKSLNESVNIPKGAIHRIENIFNKPVKIIEIQTGSILKETDIVRYKDIYGRVN